MQKDIYVNCPKCHTPLNLTAALRAFLTNIQADTLPETLYLRLVCDVCNETTLALSLSPETGAEKRSANRALQQIVDDVKKPKRAD